MSLPCERHRQEGTKAFGGGCALERSGKYTHFPGVAWMCSLYVVEKSRKEIPGQKWEGMGVGCVQETLVLAEVNAGNRDTH